MKTLTLYLIVVLLVVPIKFATGDSPSEVITPENAAALVETMRLGSGTLGDMIYSPDGETLAVGSSIGVWLYDPQAMSPITLLATTGTGKVADIEYSADGNWLVAVDDNGDYYVWETADYKLVRTLPAQVHGVNYVPLVFIPGTNTLFMLDFRSMIKWDVSSDQPPLQLTTEGEFQSWSDIALSPDGTLFAHNAGNSETPITDIYDIETGKKLATLERTFFFSGGVRFSPDGKWLASVSESGDKVNVWNLTTGERMPVLLNSTALSSYQVVAVEVAFLPEKPFVILATWFDVSIWDYTTGQRLHRFVTKPSDQSEGTIDDIVILPDSQLLAVLEWNDTQFWDLQSYALVEALSPTLPEIQHVPFSSEVSTLIAGLRYDKVANAHLPEVYGVVFAPDDDHLTVSYGSDIAIWRLGAVPSVEYLPLESLYDYRAISPDGRYFAYVTWRSVYYGDGGVKVWDMVEQKEILSLDYPGRLFTDLQFTANNTLIAKNRNTFIHWEIPTGREITDIEAEYEGFQDFAVTPDGKYIVAASDTHLQIWDAVTGDLEAALPDSPHYIQSVMISPDSRIMIATGFTNQYDDGTVQFYDLATLEPLKTLQGYAENIKFSQQEPLVAISLNGQIEIWDTQAWRLLQTLPAWFGSYEFSPDSRLIAVAASESIQTPIGTNVVSVTSVPVIQLFDVDSGQLITSLKGHTDGINRVTFSSDGRQLVSGSADGTIRIWTIGE